MSLPKGLSRSDQEDVIKILGLGTAIKNASNPYPLGGYSGIEIGLDMNFVNVDQITRLGCDPGAPGCANTERSDVQEFSYSKMSIGKGIYENFDIFISFAPFMENGNYSDYGGVLRWTFFEAKLLPIHLTAIAAANRVNFKNQFSSKNLMGGLIVGVNVEDISVYFGGGYLKSEGTFIGLANGSEQHGTADPSDPKLNSATNTSTSVVYRFHTVLGASYEFKPLFVAGEINRYEDSVYTIKAGFRF